MKDFAGRIAVVTGGGSGMGAAGLGTDHGLCADRHPGATIAGYDARFADGRTNAPVRPLIMRHFFL